MSAYVHSFYREYDLPWSVPEVDAKRLNKFTLWVLAVTLGLALLVPILPTRDAEQTRAQEVPERFVKLVIERKRPPPPPPVVVPEPAPEPEPLVQEQPKPKPTPQVEPEPVEAPPPPPEVKPQERVAQAREKASRTGVMAFADQLADLRQHSAVTVAATPQALSDSVAAANRNERSLVTAGAGSASGGINTAGLSRNTGGTQLTGRQTTTVESDVAVAQVSQAAAEASGAVAITRSREEIEMVFDRNKAAIYALYRRALRQNPGLQGKLVLRLTIAPTGQVVACEVVSSELNSPELEAKLVRRVRLFDFGAKDVSEVTTTKPIEFFPA